MALVRAPRTGVLLEICLATIWLGGFATGAWSETHDEANGAAGSQDTKPGLAHLLDNEWYKVSLDLRARIELAHEVGRP